MTTPWYDVEMRGRRMEAIYKDANTKYWNASNEDMKQSYFNRMMIIEKNIQPYIEHMTGVKKFLAQSKKELAPEIHISR